MSRSRKKHPFTSICVCESEKADKQASHRAYRRVIRERLHTDPLAELLPHWYEYSDPWAWGKDGRMRIDLSWPNAWKLLRK